MNEAPLSSFVRRAALVLPAEMGIGCAIGMFASRSLLRLIIIGQSGELLAYPPNDVLCGFGQFGNSGIAPLREVFQ